MGKMPRKKAPDIVDVLKQEYLKKKDDILVLKERIAGIKRSTRDRRDLSLSVEQRERELEHIERRLIGKGIDIRTLEVSPPIRKRATLGRRGSPRITPRTPRLRR